MVPRILLAMFLVVSAASQACADDRAAELEKLLAEYEAAEAEFYERELPDKPSTAERIERYKSYPWWTFLPKFLALAEADPTDTVALGACKWIVDRQNIGNQWRPLYDADQTAWRIFQKQQLTEEEILQLSARAAQRRSPASEAFLRDVGSRTNLPGNARAYATIALAEFLAQRFEDAEAGGFEAQWSHPPEEKEFFDYLLTQLDDEWVEYASATDAELFHKESIELLRRVLDRYADVPLSTSARLFRGHATLGQMAEQSLYALEHLVIGALAPDAVGIDLDGNPLRLSDYRGKVVVLSFWFTGCGPCIAALPEEQRLVEKFRDEPFALLGVCRDRDVAASKKTAEEHGMTWPSWFDAYPGTIVEKFNVTGFPTFYLLDAEGRIVSKNVTPGDFASAVEAVIDPSTSEAADEHR